MPVEDPLPGAPEGPPPSHSNEPTLSERAAPAPPEPGSPSLSRSSQLRDRSLPGAAGTGGAGGPGGSSDPLQVSISSCPSSSSRRRWFSGRRRFRQPEPLEEERLPSGLPSRRVGLASGRRGGVRQGAWGLGGAGEVSRGEYMAHASPPFRRPDAQPRKKEKKKKRGGRERRGTMPEEEEKAERVLEEEGRAC